MARGAQKARDARILLIDDHPLFRAGVRSTLAQEAMPVQLHEAESVPAALEALVEQPAFDLILYDWHLRGGGGVKGLMAVLQTVPGVSLLVITADEDEAIRMAAASLGAVECISKAAEPRRICDLIRRWLGHAQGKAGRGGPSAATPAALQLTQRQQEVLGLMAQGDTNKRIADKLRIAQTTVRAHVSDILRMLKTHNRTEAVVVATRSGLLDGWRSPARSPTARAGARASS